MSYFSQKTDHRERITSVQGKWLQHQQKQSACPPEQMASFHLTVWQAICHHRPLLITLCNTHQGNRRLGSRTEPCFPTLPLPAISSWCFHTGKGKQGFLTRDIRHMVLVRDQRPLTAQQHCYWRRSLPSCAVNSTATKESCVIPQIQGLADHSLPFCAKTAWISWSREILKQRPGIKSMGMSSLSVTWLWDRWSNLRNAYHTPPQLKLHIEFYV